MNRPPLPIAPPAPAVLALKALWRSDDALSAGLSLAHKLAALEHAKAGAAPREAMGRAGYDEDVRRLPCHHDGTARRSWEQIDELARESWRRNPAPRDWTGHPRAVANVD